MGNRWHWTIKVPESGPLTAEQGWAALEGSLSNLAAIISRLGVTYDGKPGPDSPLTEEQASDLRRLSERLRLAVAPIGLNAIEAVAAVGEKPEQTDEVRLIDDYYGDVRAYVEKKRRAGGWPTTPKGEDPRFALAKALLKDAVRDEFEAIKLGVDLLRDTPLSDEMREMLSRAEGRCDAVVHLCPRCDGDGALGANRYARPDCKRCDGLGYLLQEERIDTEEDEDGCRSHNGKIAANEGRPWTLAEEIADRGYDSVADYLDDGNDLDMLPPSMRDEAAKIEASLPDLPEEGAAA